MDGGVWVSARAKKIVAVVTGMLLAGASMVDAQLSGSTASSSARGSTRSIAPRANDRTRGLSHRPSRSRCSTNWLRGGVASCRADHLDKLRAANLKASPIKELSILAPDGRTLCSDLGMPRRRTHYACGATGHRRVPTRCWNWSGSAAPTKFVRVRRPALTGDNSLAASFRPTCWCRARHRAAD